MTDNNRLKGTVLIIDDEEHILQMLEMNMRNNGYRSLTATSAEQALRLAGEELPDLILLDVMLPGMSGLDLCRLFKENPRTNRIPVIMLSAKSEGKDKIDGLKWGADDYTTKPFSLEELFLRIAANLRQVELLKSDDRTGAMEMGNLFLDSRMYQSSVDGRKMELTLTEFRILHLLFSNRESLVARNRLVRDIFEKAPEESGRSLDVHIRNLRRKMAEMNVQGCRIETVRGSGLRITGDR